MKEWFGSFKTVEMISMVSKVSKKKDSKVR